MTDKQIKALATYLAGNRAAHFSVYLQMGGMRADDARKYFELRRAFGVESYETAPEIEMLLKRAA